MSVTNMYKSIEHLPALIREELPQKAQELYLAAFNRTWEMLAAGADEDLVHISMQAHKAARLAVGYEFSRDERGNWHRDPVGEKLKRKGKVGDDPGSR
jgi:cation transport regulator ChaB